MLDGSCHCGAVRITLPTQPARGNRCLCSICRRYGVVWVYFDESAVRFAGHPGETEFYARRPDGLRFTRCRSCGCVTHWTSSPDEPDRRIGVNLNLFEPEDVRAVRVTESAGPPEQDVGPCPTPR